MISFWIIAFSATQSYYSFNVVRRDIPNSQLKYLLYVENKEEFKFLKSFTWKTLGDAIADGAMYVVADGRYVYDISQWVTSHPGGRIILHSVCGTDISNDYFHEAGT